MSQPAKEKGSLRTGFTTGACAAAAAKAAVLACVDGVIRSQVETTLPNKQEHTFPLERCVRDGAGWSTSIIKDAGDDPDCTHGAEITAWASLSDKPGIELSSAEGIATVTKQGLGLELGQLAITPVPRRNLYSLVELVIAEAAVPGAEVRLSVPGGEEMAKQTLNERLGLLGGISILGTTGIVRPYSTAAYRASVVNAIDLAAAVGHSLVILTTGGKTEMYAMKLFPHLTADAFIQAGDFIGTAVKSCARVGIRGIVVGMIGKLSKMADGKMMTHAAGSKVNLDLLAKLASVSGATSALAGLVRNANTARHALELILGERLADFGSLLCRQATRCLSSHAIHAGRAAPISALLVGFDGQLLGVWPSDTLATSQSR